MQQINSQNALGLHVVFEDETEIEELTFLIDRALTSLEPQRWSSTGRALDTLLGERAAQKRQRLLTGAVELAEKLTRDLRELSATKVKYSIDEKDPLFQSEMSILIKHLSVLAADTYQSLEGATRIGAVLYAFRTQRHLWEDGVSKVIEYGSPLASKIPAAFHSFYLEYTNKTLFNILKRLDRGFDQKVSDEVRATFEEILKKASVVQDSSADTLDWLTKL